MTRVFEVWAPLEIWTGGVSPFPRLSGAQWDTAVLQLLVLLSSVSLGEMYLVPHSVPDERTQGRPCYGFGDRLGSRALKAMTL